MGLSQLEPYKGWPMDSKTEILMKQVMAALFYEMGFKIDVNLSQIEKGQFVDSLVENEDKFEELEASKIHEQNEMVYRSIRNRLFKNQITSIYDVDPSLNEQLKEKVDISKYFPKEHNQTFSPYKIEDLQESLFAGARNDNFDTPLLRYIVARKYQFTDALKMCVDCLNWRVNIHPVDKYLLEADAHMYLEKSHPELIEAFKIGQVYLRGNDKNGQPIVVVRVQKHLRQNCPDADFERFICLIIEWVRLKLEESKGINKGTILFDMTGFLLQNADLHAIKFLTSSFEANYPEYLGTVLIHNAPWVFNTIWSLIKSWLDPVVAQKIHFTKNSGLKDYIDPKYIPHWLGGEDKYEMEYVPPNEDSIPKKIDANVVKLLEARHKCCLDFIQSSIGWITAKTKQESYNYLVQRLKFQKELAKNYVALDPLLRARGPFDRNGEIKNIGL